MRNRILEIGMTILAGALAASACGGRDQRPTTTQPEYGEPAPPAAQPEDVAAQDPAMPPEEPTGAPDESITGQEMPGQSPGQMPLQDPSAGQELATGPCPADVPGTTAALEETPEGMAISFTTPGDVTGLRQRVQRLADTHNQQHTARAQAMLDEGARQQADAAGKAGTRKAKKGKAGAKKTEEQAGTPPAPDVIAMSQARVEETPMGARLVLTLTDTDQIEQLREPLRAHAEILTGPQCDQASDIATFPPGATSQRAPIRPR